jgi:hypothetical protein
MVALLAGTHMLHEHCLRQAVRITVEVIVLPLAQRPQLGQTLIAEYSPSLAEGAENVFGHARHSRIADQPTIVILTRHVGQPTRRSDHLPQHLLPYPALCTERALKILELPLVLFHDGHEARAQLAETRVVSIVPMIA